MDGRQMLMCTPASALFPAERSSLVTVWKSDPLSLAFQKMIDNNILSVPVYDRERRKFSHFLDMVDVVAFAVSRVTSSQQVPQDSTQLMNPHLLQTVTCDEVSDMSKRNPFFPVENGAPLLEVLNLMVKWGVHRIPIVDAEGELITIISQSQMSTFMYKYLRSFPSPLLTQTARSIAVSIEPKQDSENMTGSKVVSVGLNDRAVDAFIAMHEKRVSGVAVINESGTIVGNISASDMKVIEFDGALLSRLFYPVSEFLNLINPLHAGSDQTSPNYTASVVPTTATFGAVLGTLVNSRIHRVYVVDEEQRPVGVVGHTEVLRAVQESIAHDKGSTIHHEDNTSYF